MPSINLCVFLRSNEWRKISKSYQKSTWSKLLLSATFSIRFISIINFIIYYFPFKEKKRNTKRNKLISWVQLICICSCLFPSIWLIPRRNEKKKMKKETWLIYKLFTMHAIWKDCMRFLYLLLLQQKRTFVFDSFHVAFDAYWRWVRVCTIKLYWMYLCVDVFILKNVFRCYLIE